METLSGVFSLVFLNCINEVNVATGAPSFGRLWSQLGLLISTLCWFDFIAEVLRLYEWIYFMRLATGVSIVNTLVFLPIWLIVLVIGGTLCQNDVDGCSLSTAQRWWWWWSNNGSAS